MKVIIGIYQIKNKINQKSYIGKSKNIKSRFHQHKQRPPVLLEKAFNKYGIENFDFLILEECLFEQLNEREIYYIDSLKPEYNLTCGGTGGDTFSLQAIKRKKEISEKKRQKMLGFKRTEENKQNISKAKKGKKIDPHSEERKQKMSEAHLGEKNHFFGKKHSKEFIDKMKQRTKGFHWYNNGIEAKQLKECPEGWVPGRLII